MSPLPLNIRNQQLINSLPPRDHQRDVENVNVLINAFNEQGGRGLDFNGAVELLAAIGRSVLAREDPRYARLTRLARREGLLHQNLNGDAVEEEL